MDSLFTLVLMLVAITVFSIMLLAVFGLPATFAGSAVVAPPPAARLPAAGAE